MKQKSRPLFVSITGDIGSGKSIACQYFADNLIKVHSCDSIGKELYKEPALYKALIDNFGNLILTNDTLDVTKLRKLVFDDKAQLVILNNIFHPMIIEKMRNMIESYKKSDEPVVIFEVPLLHECSLQSYFDLNLLIIADHDIKLERIKNRDKCTKTEAGKILKNQMPQNKKISLADIVIENNESVALFHSKLAILNQAFRHIRKRGLM